MLSQGDAQPVEENPVEVTYFDHHCNISFDKNIKLGNVLYTRTGTALCETLFQSIAMEEVEDFLDIYYMSFWEDVIIS